MHLRRCIVGVVLVLTLCSGMSLWAQSDAITNERVAEMAKMGLDDEIIIARIKTNPCNFRLADVDLMSLREARVSAKVVAAMLEASVIKETTISIDGQSLSLHTLGQAKVGGRMEHQLSFGIMSVKQKAYLQNPRATVSVSNDPVIEVTLAHGDTIDNYLILEMDRRSDRRELEVAAVAGIVGSKQGIRSESICKSYIKKLSDNRYQIMPNKHLHKGEYILYVVGSADFQKGIFGRGYDFSVAQ